MSKRNLIFITSALLLNACMEHTIEESHDNCNNECSENQTCQLNESGNYECKTNTLPDPCNNSCSENQTCQLNESGTYECKSNTNPDPCNNGCSDNTICYEVTAGIHECVPDTDGDQKPDEVECCPYNREVTIEKGDACSDTICPSKPDKQGVFHIYHAQNFVDLYNYTINNNPNYNEFNTVILENNIDLSDLKDNNAYDRCQVTFKDSRDFSFILKNIVIKSSNGRKTIKSSECSLVQAIFDNLINCNVYNIDLSFNVNDKTKARALLSNSITYDPSAIKSDNKNTIDYYNHYIDISYSGEITSNIHDAVGGLVAEAVLNSENQEPYTFELRNCLANGISIHAPNATTVGGLVGNGEYIDLSMDNDDTLNAFIINDIEGADNVGGVIGTYTGKYCTIENTNSCGSIPYQKKNHNSNTYFRIIFNSIKGKKNVAGFIPTSASNSNIIILGNSIVGENYVAGVRSGTSNPYTSQGIINDYNSNIAVSINKITGDTTVVGGVFGLTQSPETTFSNIVTDINTIQGQEYVGGISGEYSMTKPPVGDQTANINIKYISNKINLIKGYDYVNGVILFFNLFSDLITGFNYKTSMDSISNFINRIEIESSTQISNSYIVNGIFGTRSNSYKSFIRLSNASIATTRYVSSGINNAGKYYDYNNDRNFLRTQTIGSFFDINYFNHTLDCTMLKDEGNTDLCKCTNEMIGQEGNSCTTPNESITALNQSICYLSSPPYGEYPFNATTSLDGAIKITDPETSNKCHDTLKSKIDTSICIDCKWQLESFFDDNNVPKIPSLYQGELETELDTLKEIKKTYCEKHSSEALCQ